MNQPTQQHRQQSQRPHPPQPPPPPVPHQDPAATEPSEADGNR